LRCGRLSRLNPSGKSAVLASLERALHKRQLEQQVENYRQHLEEMGRGTHRATTSRSPAGREQLRTHTASAWCGIDLRDNETPATHNVSAVTSARDCSSDGWSDKQLGSLARGAYLHDIGKLEYPTAFYSSGPLTAMSGNLCSSTPRWGSTS